MNITPRSCKLKIAYAAADPVSVEINVIKGKQLTNVRASGTDEAVRLTPPRYMSLEEMMAYINEDELLEVTPNNLRLRKRYLSAVDRKRDRKSKSL